MGREKGVFGGELQLPDLKGGHDLAAFGVPRLMGISGPGPGMAHAGSGVLNVEFCT